MRYKSRKLGKLLLATATIFCTSLFTVNAAVLDEKQREFLDGVNEELSINYGFQEYYGLQNADGMGIRAGLLVPGHRIVYGSPHDINNGVYRNWGYTREGDNYPNEDYPPDRWAMKIPMEQWQWVEAPWYKVMSGHADYNAALAKQTTIANLLKSRRFDYTETFMDGSERIFINDKYQPNIVEGLRRKYYYNPDGKTRVLLSNGKTALDGSFEQKDASGNYVIPWYKYVHILQPPTKEALGLGVMVHYSSGQYWYVTLPIAPTKAVEAVAGVYKEIDHAGGCFLDNPKKNGEAMETYIIRGLNYTITEPEAVKLSVWLVENLDQEKQLAHDSLPKSSWGKLILDKELVFTPEKPYAVEKVTYDVPQKGRKSGIIVQTGTKSTVESYTWHTPGGNLWYGSHTTSKESIMDWLPWDSIKAEYGISRGK
ncbi:hypothetical protein DFR58_14811 [Anaerobacterium chartisolvens]|uniref:Uncharacterized protein n=1 Tax=Anaerobacterium chartisolvens TaxID=1297424 RepID=A0A369AI92_9FIRM|nr:hypothetical protein [Anaerobacterium chartisolvens]RCX07877.1 hypothetical protein DFR58_14811 [Anaerobacterium chartisolvens]